VRLTQLLDSHDLGRGRGGDYREALRALPQRTLVVGIDSDLLYPVRFFLFVGADAHAHARPHAHTHTHTHTHVCACLCNTSVNVSGSVCLKFSFLSLYMRLMTN
jgi:hypothetical protein